VVGGVGGGGVFFGGEAFLGVRLFWG